jgi:hypothetical protein
MTRDLETLYLTEQLYLKLRAKENIISIVSPIESIVLAEEAEPSLW